MEKLTHRRVFKIAMPVVVSNATLPILGAVDTAVVGQIGQAAPIGAVGIGAIVIASAFWLFGFLRMGTTGMTAQAIGNKDEAETRNLLFRTIGIGFLLGIFLVIIQSHLIRLGLWFSGGSDEVNSLANDYMRIRIWSAPFVVATYSIFGWLVGHEKTTGVLVLQLWVNGLNIVLDLIFVLGFGWGVAGVAYATLIAEISGLGVGLWLVRHALIRPWPDFAAIFEASRMKSLIHVNGDIMLRSAILMACFISFTFLGSQFDDVTLAANQVLLQFLFITSYGLDGFAFAAETLVGQATGAKDRARLRQAVVLTSIWGMGVGAALGLLFLIFGWPLIQLMTTAPDVQVAAWGFLIFVVAAPFLGGPSWMLDGVFIGATRGRDMRNAMIEAAIIYVIALQFLLPAYGNAGLWMSLLVFFAARGITMGLRYPRVEREATAS